MVRRHLRTFLVPALGLALGSGACAGASMPPELDALPGRLNLFISPAGEPFRAEPGAPYPAAVWFAAADTDHDGRLSRAEFLADAERFFHSLDTDNDGEVDGFETAAYERATPELSPLVTPLRAGEGMNPNLGRRGGGRSSVQAGGGPSRRRGGGREGAALYSYLYDPQPVKAADTDFSSRITLAEARAVAERRFALLDTAKAGALTYAALPKTPVQAVAEARARAKGPSRPPPR